MPFAGRNKDKQRRAMFARLTSSGTTIFFPPKHPSLARVVTIKNPRAFRKAVRELSKGGLTTSERRALILAQNRARAMLNRKDLSRKERIEMSRIANTQIPPEIGKSRALRTRTDPFKAARARDELKKKNFSRILKLGTADMRKDYAAVKKLKGDKAGRKFIRAKYPGWFKDTDKDGVPDHKDCAPKNPRKQDVTPTEYRRWQKEHPNFVTPDVIKTKIKGNTIIEVSQGSGIFNRENKIYGVTVIRKKNGKFETDQTGINKPFENRQEAISYAKEIEKKLDT